MSCYYRALPRIIPEILLMSKPGSEIIFVSPWLEDVKLFPPTFGEGDARYALLTIQLSELLLRLARDFNMRFLLLIRKKDEQTESAVRAVKLSYPHNLEIQEIPPLHAKMIVTESLVLETSANILETSLFRNIESCTLLPNPFRNPRRYVRDKLGIMV